MKKILFLALAVVSIDGFSQSTDLKLVANPGPPYIQFSNSNVSETDARIELANDDQLSVIGADLGMVHGNFVSDGFGKGLLVRGGGEAFIKLADGASGNPSFQFVTDYYYRYGSMLVNNWGNSSNPGISVGTTRTDGTAFNVVNGVSLDANGLPGSEGSVLVTVLGNGNMGIGTTTPYAKLSVNGEVRATEVKVLANVNVPDYVFEKDYSLRSLEEVKEYIEANKHLPEVPSAKEMEKDGINVGEMNLLLLKKVEELTLYVLQLKEEVEVLKGGKK